MGGWPHLPFPCLPSGLAPPITKGVTPFQACSWMAPVTENTMDCMCGEAPAPRGWAVRSTVLHRGLRPDPTLTGNPLPSWVPAPELERGAAGSEGPANRNRPEQLLQGRAMFKGPEAPGAARGVLPCHLLLHLQTQLLLLAPGAGGCLRGAQVRSSPVRLELQPLHPVGGTGALGCSGAGSLRREALHSGAGLLLATLTKSPSPSPTLLAMRLPNADRELCVGCKLASSQTSGPAELCCSL
uniref:uncharacterized protein LOC108589499 isoform X1 n=1 Tax=Callithrix jacchus TaxID=9483 RepID=UPI00159F6323|nr:uncharacterized protein LOC108589499 isoform X1 [Callithrix jacchus]